MLGVVLLLLCVSCVSAFLSFNNASNEIIHCIENERQALLAFRAGLTVTDDYGRLPSWSTKDCCKWSGIKCSNLTGHVIKLDLSWVSYDVTGKMSPSLLELRELHYLDLSNIYFQYSPFPEFLSSFTKLKHLDLSDCDFSGTIPSQLGNLSNLNYLALSNTNLSVENLDWLSRLSSLETLYMDNVDLSRATNWLDIVKSLPFLSTLSFGDCRLSIVGSLSASLLNSSSTAQIKYLHLSNNDITSSIYSWLFNLSNSLVHLDLHGNMLKGPILEALGDYMPFLQYIDLADNQPNETLTKKLGTLSQLEYLDLANNSLTGIISEAYFSNLSRLTFLDLSLNHLHVKVSPQWFPPFQLNFIGLASCNLGPLFPNWIQTQKSFTHLDISNAGISDSIPPWFWDLPTQSQFLNLSSNNIGGTLPADLSAKFRSYPGIDLSSNSFEGPIPLFPLTLTSINLSRNKFSGTLSFLCKLAAVTGSLSFLDISHNLLTGGLPGCFGNLKELVVVNLAHNRLSGEIPSSLGSLSSLETLNLYNNTFSGKLPLSLSNCERLRFLDVGENKLTGNVPAWMGGTMSQLYILSLRSNKFFGTIPLNLCQLTKLQVLDLSMNNFDGIIPPCLNNLSAMVQKGPQLNHHIYLSTYQWRSFTESSGFSGSYADYSVIGWQGRELEFGNNLGLLKLIDLSSNKLSGEIPNEVTKLFELVTLNLSRNALQGKVPQQIGQLMSIQSLDLSRNRFSGKIPASLAQLNFLSYLDLSYNNFSGKIPSGTQLQSLDASKFIGNVGLYGLPLPSKCPGDESPPAVADTEDNRGENEDEFMKWLYMGMGTGFVTGFWGICGAFLLNRRGRHAFSSL